MYIFPEFGCLASVAAERSVTKQANQKAEMVVCLFSDHQVLLLIRRALGLWCMAAFYRPLL